MDDAMVGWNEARDVLDEQVKLEINEMLALRMVIRRSLLPQEPKTKTFPQ